MNRACIGGELNSEADDVEVVGPDGSNADDSTRTRRVEDHAVAGVEPVVTRHDDEVTGAGVLDVDRLAESSLATGRVGKRDSELGVDELDVTRAVKPGGGCPTVAVGDANVLFRDGEDGVEVDLGVGALQRLGEEVAPMGITPTTASRAST